jgi:hypothetical protein
MDLMVYQSLHWAELHRVEGGQLPSSSFQNIYSPYVHDL